MKLIASCTLFSLFYGALAWGVGPATHLDGAKRLKAGFPKVDSARKQFTHSFKSGDELEDALLWVALGTLHRHSVRPTKAAGPSTVAKLFQALQYWEKLTAGEKFWNDYSIPLTDLTEFSNFLGIDLKTAPDSVGFFKSYETRAIYKSREDVRWLIKDFLLYFIDQSKKNEGAEVQERQLLHFEELLFLPAES